MNIDQTKDLLAILEVAYPNHYKKLSDEEKVETVKLYYDFFSHHDARLVVQGLKNYIANNEYPPTIAGLHQHVKALLPSQSEPIQLWNAVVKAVRNSAYKSHEEFNLLPVECREWLGSPTQLKDFSQLEPETLNTVVRGQFLKTIGTTIAKCELLGQSEVKFICEE